MRNRFLRAGVLVAGIVGSSAAWGGTLVNLAHPAPNGAQLTFQMTDGTVMAQSFSDAQWYKLTPDNTGSYQNGTWTKMANLPAGYSADAFASAVLADGRLAISGGEYNFGNFALTNLSAIYDPLANTWTMLKVAKKMKYVGDSPSVVLPNGKYLLGTKLNEDMFEMDPSTLQWTQVGSAGKNDFNAEEGWTLLPDGTILAVDVKKHPRAERYSPDAATWASAGKTTADLQEPPCCDCVTYGPKNKCYYPPGEIGPAILRPDGTVFATGGFHQGSTVGHTSIYDPQKNKWKAGPDFPNHDAAGDSFAALLTSGNVLVEGESGELYEFDGINLINQGVNAQLNSLMVLPTGEVLIAGQAVYRSTGTYQAAWAPTISDAPSSVTRGSTYQIFGTQFNGLSQANAFGDEYETATNYPLVRITNNATGHVFYARTHDHSTMGVATGNATVSTFFDVPGGMETGASSLVVVANGIPSQPISVTVN